MKKIFLFVLLYFAFTVLQFSAAQTVHLQLANTSIQQIYVDSILQAVLKQRGYQIINSSPNFTIRFSFDNKLGKEAFSIQKASQQISVIGGDESGLIYGGLSIAEDLRNSIALQNIKARSEKPKLPFRAIKFDMPWDTYRHSYALDLHSETCKDVNYWKAFLDMMAENRFNVLSLWNLHPYVYMIKPKNFPEASPWNDAEMKEWQTLFHAIFRMAEERGIDTYVIPFNIFVSPEFAKAHNVAMDNLEHHFFVNGDTSEIVKRYTRECVTQLLQEYPDLDGMGLTLGEGMAGMTPEQREAWMKATIIEGMRLAGRKSKLVHRIPFSSTTASLGVTSIETERLTRKGIEQEAAMDFIQQPVWADLKFNWSHAHSTTKLIKVHGGKLWGAYFDPVPEDYKITWTARNEDFFCLRWGVPSFVRAHINQNSSAYVGGYFVGSETYIPAKDYFTKPGIKVNWKYAFERQWLFYKIWGRLLYNPATSDEVFAAEFRRRYGKEGANLLEAFSLAGTVPLRLASSFDFTWDFTLYSEGFMALDNEVKRVDYISVERQIKQPPIDPDYVSVMDYVKTINSGGSFSKNKITPIALADMVERDCKKALALVKDINTANNNALMFEVADVKAWSNLGLHFAEKLRGAVALQTYRTKGGDDNKQAAIRHLENALKYWDVVISITRPIYNDMPLVHYSEQNGVRSKENQQLTFHWEKLRPDVAKDVETAKHAVYDAAAVK
jgi:hypothetical protein